MSEEKKWNSDKILDIGSVGEDDFDPFGDDDFELESQQHEEKKAGEKKAKEKKLAEKKPKARKKPLPTRWKLKFRRRRKRTQKPRAMGFSRSPQSLRMQG